MKTFFGILLIILVPILGLMGIATIGADMSGTLLFVLALASLIGGIVLIISAMRDRKRKIVPTQQTEAQPEPKKKTSIILIILAVIAIGIVGYGLFWFIWMMIFARY